MTTLYLAECFTGAGTRAVYSTLKKAMEALEVHAVACGVDTDSMMWVDVHGNGWAWVPKETFDPRISSWVKADTPNGEMESVHITTVDLDQPIDFV